MHPVIILAIISLLAIAVGVVSWMISWGNLKNNEPKDVRRH